MASVSEPQASISNVSPPSGAAPPSTAKAPSAASAAASAYLSSSSSVRWGLGIVAVIVLIYVVAMVRSVANGPVGQAIGSLLGTAGGILAAIASLPPWLLIGLGFAYLLGPAVLKMGGAATRQLSAVVKQGNAATEDLKNAGEPQEYLDSYAKAIATESVLKIRTELANRQGATQDDQIRLTQATSSRVAAAEEATAKGGDYARGDKDGEAKARDIIEPAE